MIMKKIDTSNVSLASKLEATHFSRKMLRNGWTLLGEKDYLGFFLKMHFDLYFEKLLPFNRKLNYVVVSIIISKEDIEHCYNKKDLFRDKLKAFKSAVKRQEKKGWTVVGKPYKKYNEKWHHIPCLIQQIMAQPKPIPAPKK